MLLAKFLILVTCPMPISLLSRRNEMQDYLQPTANEAELALDWIRQRILRLRQVISCATLVQPDHRPTCSPDFRRWPKAEVRPPSANGEQQSFNHPIDIFQGYSSATQSIVVLTDARYPHLRQDNQRRRADRLQTGHGHSWRNPEFAKDMAPSTAQTLVAMMHTTPARAGHVRPRA